MWPSSYYHPQYNRVLRVGDAIITKIQNAVGRIEAHLRYLNGKDAHKKGSTQKSGIVTYP